MGEIFWWLKKYNLFFILFQTLHRRWSTFCVGTPQSLKCSTCSFGIPSPTSSSMTFTWTRFSTRIPWQDWRSLFTPTAAWLSFRDWSYSQPDQSSKHVRLNSKLKVPYDEKSSIRLCFLCVQEDCHSTSPGRSGSYTWVPDCERLNKFTLRQLYR